MATHRNYGLTTGFSELRHEHLQPSSVDTLDLLATLSESIDEGLAICDRNISFESPRTGDERNSFSTAPSFSTNPIVIDSVSRSEAHRQRPNNLSSTTARPNDSTRGPTATPQPSHPLFVAPEEGEHFVPDWMHSHKCGENMNPDARNRVQQMFEDIDQALKELQTARQLLSSTLLDSMRTNTPADTQAEEGLAHMSGGWLGRWADLAPYDNRRRTTRYNIPPPHRECFTARDRDNISYGVHRHVAFTTQLLTFSHYQSQLGESSYPEVPILKQLILEEFWIAGGPVWSVGDRLLLAQALKLQPPGHAALHPSDQARALHVDRFCAAKATRTRPVLIANEILVAHSKSVATELMKETQEDKLRLLAREAQYGRARYTGERPQPYVPPQAQLDDTHDDDDDDNDEAHLDDESSDEDLMEDGIEDDDEREHEDGIEDDGEDEDEDESMEQKPPALENDEEDVDWDVDEEVNPHLYLQPPGESGTPEEA